MSTEALRIDVLQEDIDEGVRANCEHCPVAIAARRALGDAVTGNRWLTVGSNHIDLMEFPPFSWVGKWRLPQEAQDFILAFDGDSPDAEPVAVYPFSFTAEPVA